MEKTKAKLLQPKPVGKGDDSSISKQERVGCEGTGGDGKGREVEYVGCLLPV